MLTNTSRFSLSKDLGEWVKQYGEPNTWKNFTGSDEKTWRIQYNGNSDLLPFMNLYEADIEKFAEFYPDMDIWLKNIHWKEIFENAEKILDAITRKVQKKSLVVIHAFPLEMVVAGEILKNIGTQNVVYNCNRIPAVNSTSKTLEASLFSTSWKTLPWLQEQVQTLSQKFSDTTNILKDCFIIFHENDSVPEWNISKVDNYVKIAIGFKENTIIYRADDLPDEKWLLNHDIREVYLFDSDNSRNFDKIYSRLLGENFHIYSEKFEQKNQNSIGDFEDYVSEKNVEYLDYKRLISEKNNTLVTGKWTTLVAAGGTEKWNKSKEQFSWALDQSQLFKIFYILIAFFILMWLLGAFGNGGSSSSGTYGWGGIYMWWGSSYGSSSSSKSSDSKSSVSSFGGGGFSKSSSGG